MPCRRKQEVVLADGGAVEAPVQRGMADSSCRWNKRTRAANWRVGGFSASLTSVTGDYKGIDYHDNRLTITPFNPDYNANRARQKQAQKHFCFSEF